MFELILANKRRSTVLVFVMLALLLALGFTIGFAVFPSRGFWAYYNGERYEVLIPPGGVIGMGIAFLLWAVQALAAYFQGDRILMAASGARELEKQDAPQLFNVVEEMTIAAGLPKPPKIYLIEDMGLNAFAAGRDPKNASLAVTAGLMGKLNRDQLQGVVAHEISHITNRDVLFMTMMGIMAGTVVLISEGFVRATYYGGSGTRYRSSGSRKEGGGAAIIMIVAIVLAILAPVVAQLIYYACSRRREYLADAGAAVYTRYPEGLASALEIIAGDAELPAAANRVIAPMYIVNPLAGGQSLTSWSSTHPPTEERIRILRGMAGGASYASYAQAWERAGSKGRAVMPASALAQTATGDIIAPHAPAAPPLMAAMGAGAGMGLAAGATASPDAPPVFEGTQPVRMAVPRGGQTDPGQAARMRQAGDWVRKLNGFRFINCACGARLKLPPEFNKDKVMCPRCRAIHATAEATTETPDAAV
jgi:heat shock protein HtpX